MFAVTVTFDLHPGTASEFMPLMLKNAHATRAEAACQRFDVLHNAANPHQVFLYELYDDAAGFDAHLQMPHFKAFAAAVEPMVAARDLRTWDEVTET